LWRNSSGNIQVKRINNKNNYNYLKRYFTQVQNSLGEANIFLRFYEKNGDILFSTKVPKRIVKNPNNHDYYIQKRFLPGGEIIELGLNISDVRRRAIGYSVIFFAILSVVTVLGGMIGWMVSSKFIQGVGEVTKAARQITKGDYGVRINNPYPDSEIRELVNMFNTMNETTERLMNELRMVTDNVAHDLRTPLTRMNGRIELALTDRSGNTDYREVCIAVANECERMKKLVNTILEISRNTSNPGALQLVSIDLCDMISELHELMLPIANDKNIELKLDIPQYEVYITADLVKVQRVASNLLENALKFTNKGGTITLVIEDSVDCIKFKVTDTGVGISEAEQPHVFERFFRSDSSRTCIGNGLGLALVHSIVKAHNWDITLESTLNIGSTFSVVIPKEINELS
jgi:signal transduction histidine kinase